MEYKTLTTNDKAAKKSTEVGFMTFNEVETIIQSRDSKKLKEVIEDGRVSDINMCSDDFRRSSLLMIACKSGFIGCARVLLDHIANINYRNYYDDSVLKSACLSRNLDMFRLLLERGITINDKVISDLFRSDEIVLNTEIATILVGLIQDVNSGNFLYYASQVGNAIIVQLLLEHGALSTPDGYGALEPAARKGHLEVVKLLLGWNTGAECISQKGVTSALVSASRLGCIEVVRCFIEHKIGVAALTAALCEAVDKRHVELAEVLIDSGADLNVNSASHRSPLISACKQGSVDMVRLLLARGGDVNAVDSVGETPLSAALPHPEVLKMLLKHEANPNIPFPNGSTALLEVVWNPSNNYMEALTVLLEHGADPNLADATTGKTPLMVAAIKIYIKYVIPLLERGADVTQVNREGKTVLDMLGQGPKYYKVVELCTGYIDSNKPGATPLLK